jgi:hypothetical protein
MVSKPVDIKDTSYNNLEKHNLKLIFLPTNYIQNI